MISEDKFKRELVLAYVTAHAQAYAEMREEGGRKPDIAVELQAGRYADRRLIQVGSDGS